MNSCGIRRPNTGLDLFSRRSYGTVAGECRHRQRSKVACISQTIRESAEDKLLAFATSAAKFISKKMSRVVASRRAHQETVVREILFVGNYRNTSSAIEMELHE